MMKHNKHTLGKSFKILPLLLALSLTGCDSSGSREELPEAEATSLLSKAPVALAEAQEMRLAEPPGLDCPADLENPSPEIGEAPEEEETPMTQEIPKPEKKTPPEGWQLTLASEDWGLSFGESGSQPRGNASPEDLAWYNAYYVGTQEEKILYLTFDCGYENGNTEPILEALKKHHAQGTFFVVGHYLETAPDLVKRMVEEGHTVGNHTYHHPDMASISDMASFQKELDDVANLFQEITGTPLAPYYRPPQGKCNVENLKMAQDLGYYTMFWSLAHVDWNQDSQPSHGEALDKLTSRIHPGAIVLLHNTSKTNGEILDELLTKWEDMGYSFRPLSELVEK